MARHTRRARPAAHTRKLLLTLCALAVTAAAPELTAGATESAGAGPLVVFAAASLTDALQEADAAFRSTNNTVVQESFAASSVLAKQIEAGAPADVFFSADQQWMDYLAQRDLLARGSRRDLLGNALVLIAPADSTLRLKIAPGLDLAGALGAGKLAIGDPDSVPAGLYARAALTKLGVWSQVQDHLVRAENVRSALAYVARGEAPLGIVYRTDAEADKRVRLVDVFPADSHPPIIYPLALTQHARASAPAYVKFLEGATARRIFERYGFVVLPRPSGQAPH
jgi:molybdate transport system substrate-binding protein